MRPGQPPAPAVLEEDPGEGLIPLTADQIVGPEKAPADGDEEAPIDQESEQPIDFDALDPSLAKAVRMLRRMGVTGSDRELLEQAKAEVRRGQSRTQESESQERKFRLF